MECTAEGTTQEAFETILYGKYRAGRAQIHLDRCKAVADAEQEATSQAAAAAAEPEAQ